MHKVIISAPFGNYLNFPYTTPILGTFTREYRAGAFVRWWRVLTTVRYYPSLGAWKNRLRLPNPGIDWLARRVALQRIDPTDKILSVSARETSDWTYLMGVASLSVRPGYVELNVSCPNCPGEYDHSDYDAVFSGYAQQFPGRSIVKLPPVGYRPIAERAMGCGITSFHCCNTLFTPGGGLSGVPLKLLSLQAVGDVGNLAAQKGIQLSHLIGGGGNRTWSDMNDYLKAGATSAAVASTLFFPWNWRKIKLIAKSLAELQEMPNDP